MAKDNGDTKGGLDRDFGYLMPFFDKVAQAAGAVQDPAARAELARLIDGEKAKWERVRALLAGAPARRAGTKAASLPPGQPSAQPGFTVGSLRRR